MKREDSAFQTVFAESYDCIAKKGSHLDGAVVIPKLLHGPGWEKADNGIVLIPVAAKAGSIPNLTRAETDAGVLMLENSLEATKAMEPSLIENSGKTAEEVDEMLEAARAEIRAGTVPVFTIWHNAWAVKQADETDSVPFKAPAE